ncbi:hypothetical protein [Mesorhizobium xinjiangense]|uniref:hypothetical protein n=1 Tax=Mesorhizobium xinjiangense TaxID=2678685 RepID=UPI0012ED4935|nr:hypothetical protein [Mesorhizobium xinjiangense]
MALAVRIGRRLSLSWQGGLAASLVMAVSTQPALAHAAERGFVLLLPTGHYRLGGALAVLASFLLLAFVPPRALAEQARRALVVGRCRADGRVTASLLAFLWLVFLILTGWFGSPDPLSNPLPLFFWSIFWIGLTIAQGLIGNLWAWLNPWTSPHSLFVRATGWRTPFAWALNRLGYWPALAGFFAFAWFELVYPAPDDPRRLALVVGTYWLFTFFAMLVFGPKWLARGECISVFLSFVSRMAPLACDTGRATGTTLSLRWPGARLVEKGLPFSGALFVLFALAAVSFDGLMHTFTWFGLNGLNPLEFPGRSAVIGVNSIGLLVFFTLLAVVFFLAVDVGERLAGGTVSTAEAAGRLVLTLVPIALAYHFAHYLGALLVSGQYALAAISDPFATGLDLFGTADMPIVAAVTSGADAAWIVWNLQAAAIVAGHILAVAVAHVAAYERERDARHAVVSQLPLALLMVAYTVFGLWLLSTPSVA